MQTHLCACVMKQHNLVVQRLLKQHRGQRVHQALRPPPVLLEHHHHLCAPCNRLGFFGHNLGELSHTRALRAAGTLQGVPPSCCGRRVAVWSGVCSSRPSGFGEAARRASSLRTWRWRVRRSPCPSSPTTHPPYVPRPSAVDHLDRDMLQRLTCSHCHRCVGCPVSTTGSLGAERGG